MTIYNGKTIVNDNLLAYVYEFYCNFIFSWVCFEHRLVERDALLNEYLNKIHDNIVYIV